jgi:hypothetical protein
MAHSGYYILIEKNAPMITHVHFGQFVGYMEFLEQVLGKDCVRVREVECRRHSTFLGLLVEAYEWDEKVVFFTEFLFSNDEAQTFVGNYMSDHFSGLRAMLRARKEIDLRGYVRGRIALALDTDLPVNGRLEVNFSLEGVVSLPYLYEMQMHYTAPRPGNFARVELDTAVPSIYFFVD